MTCKDCKHFYNREPKPWRDIFDLGYCDHSREGKIEINKYCPVNKWCDNKFEPKEDSWGRKIVSVNLKVENIYKHESDFSDIDDDIEDEEIEDSWESVSK